MGFSCNYIVRLALEHLFDLEYPINLWSLQLLGDAYVMSITFDEYRCPELIGSQYVARE